MLIKKTSVTVKSPTLALLLRTVCLSGFLLRTVCFDAEREIDYMEQPYSAKDYARYKQTLAEHHKESECHEERNRDHNAYLHFFAHALTLYIGFQIIFV